MSQLEKNREYREMRRWIDEHLGGWRVGDMVMYAKDSKTYRVVGFTYGDNPPYDEGWSVVLMGQPNAKDELFLRHFSQLRLVRRDR